MILIGLLVAATVRAGQAGAAVLIVALLVVMAAVIAVGRLRRRTDRRHAHRAQRSL